MKHHAQLLLAAVVLMTTGCGGNSPVAPVLPSAPTAPIQLTPPPPSRVVIVSIDGLRPDAVLQTGAPSILALAARGAYTWYGRTIQPSTTLPAHVSMLSGYTPDIHGITWDDYTPTRGSIQVPTLFSAARYKGLRTSMVVGKDKFAVFRDAGGCDVWAFAANDDDSVTTRAIAEMAKRPDLLFVHLPGVDLTGHVSEWMSEPYLAAVRKADQNVGRLVAALPSDVTIIVTADHGGHQLGHGTVDATDMTIPWVIAGPAIVKGVQLSSSVHTLDTAVTAAYALGVELPPDVRGRVVREAFAPTSQAPALSAVSQISAR